MPGSADEQSANLSGAEKICNTGDLGDQAAISKLQKLGDRGGPQEKVYHRAAHSVRDGKCGVSQPE